MVTAADKKSYMFIAFIEIESKTSATAFCFFCFRIFFSHQTEIKTIYDLCSWMPGFE